MISFLGLRLATPLLAMLILVGCTSGTDRPESPVALHRDGPRRQTVNTDFAKLPRKTIHDRAPLIPILNDGVQEFRLTADEIQWEYADGKSVHAWAYNGQIPGPEIRVTEGDKVRVIVTNNLPRGTTIHWHGVRVPENEADGVPGLDQYPIKPGETFTYEFTAVNAGTHFYHTHGSSHTDVALQDDMGLHGPFIIEPRDTTDPRHSSHYDREYVYMLDEWTVGEDGSNSALQMVSDDGKHVHQGDPNTFTVNGRIFPDNLQTDTLLVREGERVLVRLINDGSKEVHPMHTHGHAFRVIGIDGAAVPKAQQLPVDMVTLHPGERRDIEIIADNPGVWLFHCHDVHHASAGMIIGFFYEGYEPCCLEEEAQEESNEPVSP